MAFIFRILLGFLAVLVAVAGLWMAAHRDAPGPSLLAYATYDGKADIVAKWPDNRVTRRLVDTPAHDTQPHWSPTCTSAADCRLTYVLNGTTTAGEISRQIQTASLVRGSTPAISPLAGENFGAAWSPDGAYVASVMRHNGQTDIYMIRVRDGVTFNFSDHPTYDAQPFWSPDGNQIAFVSTRDSTATPPRNAVFVATLDDHKRIIDLRRISTHDLNDKLAGWSPDGQWVMFTAGERWTLRQRGNVYIARADGSEMRRLTSSLYLYAVPVWSPDGAWIAFEAVRDNGHDILAVRPDGTDLHNLSNLPGMESKPAWSPDGAWLVFGSRRDGNHDIYAVRPDGSDLHNLSDHPALDVGPVWSPDGQWIAFESTREGNREIFIVQPDGSHLTNISLYRGIDAQPAWSSPVELAYRPWLMLVLASVLGIVAVVRWPIIRLQALAQKTPQVAPDIPPAQCRHNQYDRLRQ